jgi:DNA-binding transcriptional LysR family regulator
MARLSLGVNRLDNAERLRGLSLVRCEQLGNQRRRNSLLRAVHHPSLSNENEVMKTLAIADFKLVVQLSQQLSVAAVARERAVPPSQVSRALTRIETACGLRLFHRTTHGISLTAEGHTFVEHAQQILNDAHALSDHLAARTAGAAGAIKISVSSLLAERVLIPKLSELLATYPDLLVSLNITDRLVDMALEGIDIAIRAGVPPRDTFVARRLGGHTRQLYAAPSYLVGRSVSQTVADLSEHRLISNTAVPQHNQWQFAGGSEPRLLRVKGHTQADNSAAVLSLALAGLGIARLNSVIAQPLVERGALVVLMPEFSAPTIHEIHAVTLSSRNSAPKIRLTMRWLEDCFVAFREPPSESNGIPLLPPAKSAQPVTLELVNQLRDETPQSLQP